MNRLATGFALSFLSSLLLGSASPVLASPSPGDPGAQPAAQQQGPLVLEPVKSGFVIAPEARVTRVNGLTRSLVGAYGGWQVDDHLLLGGGGYWLPDRAGGIDMGYGGGVVGWKMPLGHAAGVAVRALVGGGQASVAQTITFQVPFGLDGLGFHDWMNWNGQPMHVPGSVTRTARFRYAQGFAIAEPQADFLLHLTRRVAIDAGAGYRFIGAAHGLAPQLRGAVGSVGLRLGAGS